MKEIAIKISEEDYNNIEPFLKGEEVKGGFNLFKALEIIKNGTPLPKGRWIATENEEMNIDGYFCSCCDLPMETEERTKYCPNCGAEMEEKK